MPSFEEEALARAQQLSHTRTKAAPQPREHKREEAKEDTKVPVANKSQPPISKPRQDTPESGLLDIFFKDKERSVILMLLLLLMDEKTDAGLLIALVYLLV